MFGTIRKHSKVMWGVLIVLMSISLVYWATDQSGREVVIGSSGQALGTLNDREISREEYDEANRETLLRYLFAFGQFPASDAEAQQRGVNLQQETVQRLLVKEALRQQGITAGDSAVAAFIAQSRAFRDPQDGGFRKEAYENFIAQTLPRARLTEADFLRYARTELGIQQLQDYFGQSGGLLTAAEAEDVFRRESEQFLAEIVQFDPADYADKVDMKPAKLAQFYTNQMASFRVPDRLVVEFVKFDFSNHLAEAEVELAKQTNLAARIDAFYLQRGAQSFLGTNNLPLSPEEAKAKIRAGERDNLAQLAARKAANAFATVLYDREPRVTANLATLAKEKGLTLVESLPFSRFDIPDGLEVMENFAQQAFAIDAEEPFKGPIPGANAYFVIAVKKRLPSEVPPMESILQRVMDGYRSSEAVTLTRAAGMAFGLQAREAMAKGKSFAQAATDAKLTARPLPAFANSSDSIEGLERSVSVFEVQSKARDLKVGGVSDYTGGSATGFVLHLKGIQPVPEEELKKQLPGFTERFREMRRRQAFQEWLQREMTTTRVTGLLAPTVGSN